MATFGERLRELRKEKKMTIQEMADFLKVSRRLISFYESGEREPNYETLIKLSEFFNCSVEFILGISDYRLSHSQMNGIIEEIVDKYKIDVSDPAIREKLELVIKIVAAEVNKDPH